MYAASRFHFRYSLRSLMAVTVCLSLLLSWGATRYRQAQREAAAAAALQALGGKVTHWYEAQGGTAPAQAWFDWAVRRRPKSSVQGVTFWWDTDLSDTDLAQFNCFGWLEEIAIYGDYHHVSPQGLRQLASIGSLRRLLLTDANMTDDHATALAEFQQLAVLDLRGRNFIGADRLEALRRALPDCEIRR